MEVLTIDSYFSVLEKCTLEAFETLKLIDLYPKDGTKPLWAVGNMTIEKNGLLTESEKVLFRNEYIKENLRVTFLTAIDRFCKDYEVKYLVKRDFFYKKCYEALLYKFANSELYYAPDFGFKIDSEPDVLNFIWKMRFDIETRGQEVKHKISKEYKFNQTLLLKILNFKNDYDEINDYYYLKLFNQYKNELNETLNKFDFETEYLSFLQNFNAGIELLLIEIIKHYKNVMNFENSKMQNFEHYNYRDGLNLKAILSLIKSYSNKLIDFKLKNKSFHQLKKMQDYCINTLLKSLELLRTQFEIDVFESPLKSEFLDIKKSLKKAINKIDLNPFEVQQYRTEANDLSNAKVTKDKDLTKQKWFSTGIKLATGEAFKIYKKLGANSPTEICRELKVDTSNKTYISATINNYDNSKNIFNDPKKLIALHKYITDHQLNFGAEFLEKHNQIEPD